jgi:hypothetical protein
MRRTYSYSRALAVAALWTAFSAANAHAHGGIAGPDELGPPFITSAVLGIAGYWLMMLWPARARQPRSEQKRKPARRAPR